MNHLSISHLTARENQILRMVAEGFSAKVVAKKLGIAPGTVERHIENVRLKTGTRNRTHMIAVALRDGWLQGSDVNARPASFQFAGDPAGSVSVLQNGERNLEACNALTGVSSSANSSSSPERCVESSLWGL